MRRRRTASEIGYSYQLSMTLSIMSIFSHCCMIEASSFLLFSGGTAPSTFPDEGSRSGDCVNAGPAVLPRPPWFNIFSFFYGEDTQRERCCCCCCWTRPGCVCKRGAQTAGCLHYVAGFGSLQQSLSSSRSTVCTGNIMAIFRGHSFTNFNIQAMRPSYSCLFSRFSNEPCKTTTHRRQNLRLARCSPLPKLSRL